MAILVAVAFQAGVAVGSADRRRWDSSPEPTTQAVLEARNAPSQPAGGSNRPSATPAAIPSEAPPCRYGNVASKQDPAIDWAAIVLDTEMRLDHPYVPPDLVDASAAGLNDGHLVREIMVRDLRALARAARGAGAAVAIQSSYRSFAHQHATCGYWVSTVGRDEAILRSARPGHSEHHLGTAIDFSSAAKPRAPWEDRDWARTDAGAWLAANAWRFGFVMSYPRGATSVSCYAYEPWHYRYFGRSVAARIHESGLPARQWLLEAATGAEASGGSR